MAQIARFISSKDLIWRLYRDSAVQDQINQSDVYEWIIEVLSLIGAPAGFVHKVTGHKDNPNLDIVNYRSKLPCDFHKLRQISINGFPALPSTNSFHMLQGGECCGTDELGSLLSDGTFIDNFGNTFLTSLGTKYGSAPLTYELNNDYITLSVKEGKVCMSYLAHAVDKEGFPMIPDDISYIKAVEWYCMSKIDYIRWRNNPDSPGLRAIYENSDTEYMWAVGQAAGRAKMPDVNEMELIKNQLLRLKPEPNQWENFYKNLGQPELRKLK